MPSKASKLFGRRRSTMDDGDTFGHRLTDGEIAAVDRVRQAVQDVIPDDYDSDFNIYRWLKAWHYDEEVTVRRLRVHFRLRSLIDLPYVMKMDFSHDIIYTHYVPIGVVGPSGRGNRFVIIEASGKGDPGGLLKSVQPTIFMMHRFKLLFTVLQQMMNVERKTGCQSGLIYIHDLAGMEMDPMLLPVILTPFRILWTHISDNFPEMIHKLIIINPPSFVSILWKAVKPWLPENTKSKVVFAGSDWQTELLQYVAPQCLPVHWGGTLKGANNDAMCRDRVVVPSSKVPKHLYWTPSGSHPTLDDLVQTSVSAGSRVYTSFMTATPDTILHWYLQCDHEFTVAAYFDPSGSNITDHAHIESCEDLLSHMEQPGTVVIDHMRWPLERIGTYHFKLGNEKAWLKSVTVNQRMDFETRSGDRIDDVEMI